MLVHISISTGAGRNCKLLESYDIATPRTDRRTVIGNKRLASRKCRFCHRTAAEGATFRSVAHAIPTALGNDHLKIADECDECNNHFGRETEPSLIAMLDVQRAFLGTQGRGKNDGRPELQFSEGKIYHDGQKLNIHAANVSKDDATNAISVELGSIARAFWSSVRVPRLAFSPQMSVI
jgi:HNH endonuclease